MSRDWLLLTPLARHGDAGLLALRLVTGAFLVFLSHNGLLTRWAGLVTAFTFIVAVWMVHWPQDFPGWWGP